MLTNYQKAFKAYDIRGTYGSEIDEHFSYTLGKAIGKYFAKTFTAEEKFLITSDARNQNPKLIKAFEIGIHETNPTLQVDYGAFRDTNISTDKYPYGICSTSTAYYLGYQDYALSVTFTASHNPPEDVGMKFFYKNVVFVPSTILREMFEKEYTEPKNLPLDKINIQQVSQNIIDKKDKLIQTLLQKREKIEEKYHFIVDFSNGAGVSIEKEFFEKLKNLGNQIDYLNDTPDGNFSAHLSETQDAKNYEQLIHEIQKKGADFGLMFDGDVDRIGLVTNTGVIMPGDMVAAMIAKKTIEESQEKEPTILYEVMSSKTIPETVEKLGAKSKLVRVGRFFINQYLREAKGIFAGETSGHFLFKEMGYHEMPPLALYYFVAELKNYTNAESMLQHCQIYHKSPVISIKDVDKEKAIAIVKKSYAQYPQETIDGISVFADNFRFNLRASNTENKIKFTLEADDLETMNKEKQKLETLLKNIK